MIRVRIIGEEKEYVFDENLTPLDIFRKLNLNPDEWLVVLNGKIIPDDMPIKEGSLLLLPVVSGG